MTIRKGEDWGSEGPMPVGTEICADDFSVHEALNRAVEICRAVLME